MTISSRVKLVAALLLGAAAIAAVLSAPFLAHLRRVGWLRREPAYVAPERHPRVDTDAFAQYAGSDSCRDCHREAYDLWRPSNHGMAERRPDAALDEPAFSPPRTFRHGTQQTAVGGTNTTYTLFALGRSNALETLTVERVIGHDPLRQFLVAFPGGRLQTMEASYDPKRDEWFNVYGDEDRRPGEWGHWTGRGMNWNNMCAGCHNTRVRKNYDASNDTYRTTMAEATVGCEACHGPLKAHVEWRRVHTNTVARDPTVPVLTPVQHFETCATCHARRMELTGDFVPGDRFDDHHILTIPDSTDLYYSDGQVRDEDYEYAAFLGSRMANAGIRCADCHEPHAAKPRFPGNLLCMRCHAEGGYTNAPVIDPIAHGFHKVDPAYGITNGLQMLMAVRLARGSPTNSAAGNRSVPLEGEPVASRAAAPPPPAMPDLAALTARDSARVWADGGECVNCHMPQTYYMQRHRRHDHGQTIPDPLLTKQLGIPNACNRCHTDQSVDWALAWTQTWYGDKMERPYRQRARLVAAARTGDASARAGLLTMLTGDTNAYWRAVAAEFLEPWAGEPDVTPALLAATHHTNALVRAHAAKALGTLVQTPREQAVEPALRSLLSDPVFAVRYSAEWALHGRLDSAAEPNRELRAVLDYVSDQPVGQMQLGAYCLARGDLAGADTHYQRSIAWDEYSAPLRHDYAVVLAMLGKGSNAVAQLEAACRLQPRESEYRYKLALAWNEIGRMDLTITNLLETVALDPRHDRAWYNLGLAYAGQERLTDAAGALQRAAALTATPDASYALATVCARAGDVSGALAAIERVLRLDPNHAGARQLRAALEQQLVPRTPRR